MFSFIQIPEKNPQKITIDNIARSSQNILRAITTAKILQCNKKTKNTDLYSSRYTHSLTKPNKKSICCEMQ